MMDLAKIRNELLILGTPGGENPEGNCTICAVMAADALMKGEPPLNRAPPDCTSVDVKAAEAGAKRVMEILPDHMRGRHEHSRAYLVWCWLRTAQNGVYVFEQSSDHVYNFVVDGNIYLIDTALCFARKVNTPGDCSVNSIPYPGPNGYRYLSPVPDDDPDTDSLSVYCWGALHPYWR
jgi:hypothetical protein